MKAFRCFCVVIVLSLILVTVNPAQADAWVPITRDFSGNDPYSCGSFVIYDDWGVHFEGKLFNAQDGNSFRIIGKGTFHDRFYNPINGKEATGQGQFSQFETSEFFSQRGLVVHVVVPGAGRVVIDSGYFSISFDPGPSVIFHGNHQFFEDGDLSKLCAILQ